MRLALGATRARLVRQLLTESVLLSALGGAAGLLLAVWTLDALYPFVLSSVPLPAGLKESFALDLAPDYRVFAFTLLASLAAGLATGLAPALQASRPDLNVSGGGAFMLSMADPIGPMPGIVERRRLTSSSRCHFISLASISSRRASTAAYSRAWKRKRSRAISGRVSSSSTRLIRALTFCLPVAPIMPNSAA